MKQKSICLPPLIKLMLLIAMACPVFFACATDNKASDAIPVVIDRVPANPQASSSAKAVLAYLAELSSSAKDGVVSGQSCGHGNQIADSNNMMGAAKLIGKLEQATGKVPGILALDYEHDKCFTPAELSAGNKVLIDHWKHGGLVSVGFSPQSPWLCDESNLATNQGNWQFTRTTFLSWAQKQQINLPELLDPTQAAHKIWRKKLDRIAAGLQELRDAGVVVLFKPMQEQNGFWFWWGIESHPGKPDPYIALYRDMFHYFSVDKGLDNLLWLYSPNKNSSYTPGVKALDWLYPGNDCVDIIAPTYYNNEITLYDFDSLRRFGKTMAVAELGPDSGNQPGTFDDRTYAERLSHDFPQAAFWISWHDWDNGNGTATLMSIVSNKHAVELMNDPRVINRDTIAWKSSAP